MGTPSAQDLRIGCDPQSKIPNREGVYPVHGHRRGILHAALVDCGATGQFIDQDYVWKHRLSTQKLTRPIPVFNVDGTRKEAGSIKEVVNAILRFEEHTEQTTFAVTSLGSQAVILGFTWLEEHNPRSIGRPGRSG